MLLIIQMTFQYLTKNHYSQLPELVFKEIYHIQLQHYFQIPTLTKQCQRNENGILIFQSTKQEHSYPQSTQINSIVPSLGTNLLVTLCAPDNQVHRSQNNLGVSFIQKQAFKLACIHSQHVDSISQYITKCIDISFKIQIFGRA
ncbi:hypothetical protein EGW08_016442 [Elysia chlorotica]|uniref:Uncharacterized protein n=1 Tax=Elysia chlorotica TaxID=188477 RepID=A0A3S1AZ18_ELYCH|nr:hypothetical protein EGW08_016442 [Elysia chlorotica]